ncbi:G-type lectin S-receptor-like serine/threonine-protein kinase At5g35370 isoform X2 [Ananas comosus]|uniref:Receptor-like serine/threonine-protein kinase n=1 Tax=Ananas comosus TaxID=4615 RepID=A0A6P5GQR8_ANACO|nr:G-type lectin S-receptor-like serine/threonine-protein kinase At5g35370 isoform X2 [Ananas comosus]
MRRFAYPLLFLSVFHQLLLNARLAAAGAVAVEYLYPNFTASSLLFIDTGGVFLASRNGVFQAAVYNPGAQQSRFYFSVLHAASGAAVWAANRAAPIPDRSGLVALTPLGLAVTSPSGSLLWSTPPLAAPAAALRLLDSGDLALLDARNASLWRSFDHPADALVSDQPLRAGANLTASASDTDFAEGDYRLAVTPADAALAWGGGGGSGWAQFWSLAGDVRSAKDRNAPVAYMAANASGLYLYAADARVVFELPLPPAPLRILRLGRDGALRISSYAALNASAALGGDFVAPSGPCDLPLACGPLGLCSGSSNASTCACPPLFVASHSGGCELAANGPRLLSSSNCTTDDSNLSYLGLRAGIEYFANKYAAPTTSGGDGPACRSRCSGNCTCLGYFYDNSSMSCYLLESRQLGSLFVSSSSDGSNPAGYIKTVQGSPSNANGRNSSPPSSTHFVAILLPSIASLLLVAMIAWMGIHWWRSQQKKQMRRSKPQAAAKEFQLRWQKSPAKNSDYLDSNIDDDESDDVFIPGLPTRFTFAELEAVTNNFQTKIGSGGFGAVYKGELPDKTLVAVKRIDAVGLQRKREFCTEMAVIGNIRHVNLVRLRGFCAQGARRLLVYEYMNRGSLDRSLFGSAGPALEWGERMEVAIGAARGLAYLHSGCDHKIVHCDVKPENILLADAGQVKIADFGLAKLMGPDQSGLFTTMRGTRGYLAPEWLTNAAISDRTDVYSFGMVLLELVRGRKNRTDCVTDGDSNDSSSGSWSGSGGGGEYFPMLALERHAERRYRELADPRLEGRVREEEVERVVKVALCCLHEEPALRPSMSAVAGMLDGTMGAAEPRVASLNFLRLYGRGFAGSASAIRAANDLFGGRGGAGNPTGSMTSTATTTSESPSHMSSQQVSGPR